MADINRFLLDHELLIAGNPCISPDFCLDWNRLQALLRSEPDRAPRLEKSRFESADGTWHLREEPGTGDCAWELEARSGVDCATLLAAGIAAPDRHYFPATWENLLRLKNLVQGHDPGSTIFPSAGGDLGRRTLGIGARFTTLHWPAVEWAMSALELGLTANQNSIPRELVYDVEAMLTGRLDSVPFPFLGTRVPEGHQGQSVEGMSHGCVLSKLRHGFHRRRIAWSFNADHQPIGGAFDNRETALVRGCILASYITFDLSPELALAQPAAAGDVDPAISARVSARLAEIGIHLDAGAFEKLVQSVWPALQKMRRRDRLYREARERTFTTQAGRAYLRELSIDELPGLTAPETTAVMLGLCEAMDMPVSFIAPAFGFQKNLPYPDQAGLHAMVAAQWDVARRFGASIGFHSGSGKSAENYRVMGEVTGGCLEIKTSGRYTYEMGRALFGSSDPADQALWRDWYAFTLELALAGAFSADPTEQRMARGFIRATVGPAAEDAAVFGSPDGCRAALGALPASPDSMVFFEYNFLFVLAAGGRAHKGALGDHSEVGYRQRARFYGISAEARLLYSKHVAAYIVFLAECTGLVGAERCAAVRALLGRIATLDEFLGEISR